MKPLGGQEPDAHRVDEAVVRVGLVEDGLAADRRDADASSRSGRCRRRRGGSAWSGSPNRSPSRIAIGRAPIATMSRRIPPTPVAAPWNGSTADGWLCDSTLNATASPSPRSITPAFSPGPCSTRSPCGGEPLQQEGRVLVAAVLRPEEREDGELEVVRARARAAPGCGRAPRRSAPVRGGAAVPARPASRDRV